MDKQEILHIPPFPELVWDEFSWAGSVDLPSWSEFQNRLGAYNSKSDANTASGSGVFPLAIEAPGENRESPAEEQAAALRYLLENQSSIRDRLLQAVFLSYPQERTAYRRGYGYKDSLTESAKASFEQDYGNDVPELFSSAELKKVMGLSRVHLLSYAKDDFAYIGFEFGCNWDEEHGLGIMTHKNQIIELGSADVAFRSVDEKGSIDLNRARRDTPAPILHFEGANLET